MQRMNITLALAAGLLGGFLSRTVSLPSVHAQNPTAPRTVTEATEFRAQRLALVDDQNNLVGTFTSRVPAEFRRQLGPPAVVLLDPNGRVIWAADQRVSLKPLSENR